MITMFAVIIIISNPSASGPEQAFGFRHERARLRLGDGRQVRNRHMQRTLDNPLVRLPRDGMDTETNKLLAGCQALDKCM